eukprot:307712_1
MEVLADLEVNEKQEEQKEYTFQSSVNANYKPNNKSNIKQPLLHASINREYATSNINNKLTSDKKLRDVEEICSHLNYCLPPYMDKYSILKCIFLFFGGLITNVIYIISNFYSSLYDSRSNYAQRYLWISKLIITYWEFCGICGIFMALMYGIFCKSKSSKSIIIDSLSYMQSWSTFKLFFIFRPQSLIDYWSTCYQHSQ